jgi:hypothetical protein
MDANEFIGGAAVVFLTVLLIALYHFALGLRLRGNKRYDAQIEPLNNTDEYQRTPHDRLSIWDANPLLAIAKSKKSTLR